MEGCYGAAIIYGQVLQWPTTSGYEYFSGQLETNRYVEELPPIALEHWLAQAAWIAWVLIGWFAGIITGWCMQRLMRLTSLQPYVRPRLVLKQSLGPCLRLQIKPLSRWAIPLRPECPS